MKKFIFLVVTLIYGFALSAQKHTVSGHLLDADNGEAMISATVYVKEIATGTLTNTYGFYSITLDPGTYEFTYSYLGYDDLTQVINLTENISLDIELNTSSEVIDEVVVTAAKEVKDANVESTEMSKINLHIKAIQKTCAFR